MKTYIGQELIRSILLQYEEEKKEMYKKTDMELDKEVKTYMRDLITLYLRKNLDSISSKQEKKKQDKSQDKSQDKN